MADKFDFKHITTFRRAFNRFAIAGNPNLIYKANLSPLLCSLGFHPRIDQLSIMLKNSNVLEQSIIPFRKFLEIVSMAIIYSSVDYIGADLSEAEFEDLLNDVRVE